MKLLAMRTPPAARRGFTLIEILIVVVILGILAGIVVIQYVDLRLDADDAVIRGQLRTLRSQIELYRVKTGDDPKLVAKQWEELLEANYIHAIPVNPLNKSSQVKGAAEPGSGWAWRPVPGSGVKQLFATDATGTSEYSE